MHPERYTVHPLPSNTVYRASDKVYRPKDKVYLASGKVRASDKVYPCIGLHPTRYYSVWVAIY